MKVVLQLLFAEASLRKVRMLLTSFAVIAAACVVVWVVSGYDALLSQFDQMSNDYLGRYDVAVVSSSPADSTMPAGIAERLESDPAVALLSPAVQVRALITYADQARPGRKRRGNIAGPGNPFPLLVGTDALAPPYPVNAGQWIHPNSGDNTLAAMSSDAAAALDIRVGDRLILRGEGISTEHTVTVVGLVEETSARSTMGGRSGTATAAANGPASAALYVPISMVQQVTKQPAQPNLINIALKPGEDPSAFHRRWTQEFARTGTSAAVLTMDEVREGLESGGAAASAKAQACSATAMSLLAALFIIFTTLSMGVNERIRQFAVLRAIGLTSRQIVSLIFAEALLLAVIGWLGGLAAGWALLELVYRNQPTMFAGGASLGTWSIVLTAACALGGALAAAVIPAWRATRVKPLDAMAPLRMRGPGTSLRVGAIVAGLLLICVNPLLVFVVPMHDGSRYSVYMAIGVTTMVVGFLLLVPLIIHMVERWCAIPLAHLLKLEPGLLQSQLRSNTWRTLGTAATLTIGLGLFVATQIWGYSMLRPFVPGAWVPDIMLNFTTGALSPAEVAAVQGAPGILGDQCLPLAVEQPRLAADLTGSAALSTVTRQDNVILIGLDPRRALGTDEPLLSLEFVEGTAEIAIERMTRGRACIVPDHFARAARLHVGDTFSMLPPDAPDRPVEYTVAGIVRLPGWHWMTKFSGLRRRASRSAAMVFAPFDDVQRDFNLPGVNFFWLNTVPGTTIEQLGAAVQPIADRNAGERAPVVWQGTWSIGATNVGENLRISSVADVRQRIETIADSVIWGMSKLPLVTLLIASLGVINTIVASVRARRWDFGILRSHGMTRFAIVRLVFGEAILVAVVACMLSLALGLMAGWCGAGISQHVSFFGGLAPSLVVPVKHLAYGFSLTIGLCLLAALWPAFSVGRSEPLRLLQAGRTAI